MPTPATVKDVIDLTPAPRQPSDLDFLYIVWYIPSRATHSASRCFRCETTDLSKVIARAKRHCETQGFRFLRVDSFVCDLDRLDEQRMGSV